MSKQTCEIDGKIFEGVPLHEDALHPCQGCAGYDNQPDVCIQLADCVPDNIIWVKAD